MPAPLRLALIGIGHIAEHQLRAVALTPNWCLTAACDLRSERRALLPDNTPFYSLPEDLLRDTEVDLLLVSTPNVTHYEIGRKVLESGKNLLLEKPCCQTRKQMGELIGLAKERGLFFSVAMHASQAPDVIWFVENHASRGLYLADISGFESGFFDPLIQNGQLSSAAASLGDSWFDSGINALSVIGSLVPSTSLKVEEARLTHIPVRDCRFPQASVSLSFSTGSRHGRGTIETNWALGLNRKTTRLYFGDRRAEVLLDHSQETVVFFEDGREGSRIDLRNDRPRLVNHYIGVLNDAHARLERRSPNIDFAHSLHDLLFDAIEMAAS
jgi:D-galactose 1-dehydrogenase